MQCVNTRSSGAGATDYKAGSVLALVTWSERDDPHWFGGRIPGMTESVEFVEVAASGGVNHYRRFAGEGMAETHPAPTDETNRSNFIENLAPAWLP